MFVLHSNAPSGTYTAAIHGDRHNYSLNRSHVFVVLCIEHTIYACEHYLPPRLTPPFVYSHGMTRMIFAV